MDADLVVTGGKIFYRGEFIDAGIAVSDGRIVNVARKASLPKADEEIDARRLYVLPGAVDAHVHVRDLKESAKEDFTSASHAAAAGGVTTILAMPNTKPPIDSSKALGDYKKIANKKSIVDYGIHFGASKNNTCEIEKVRDVASIKVYMSSTTGELLVPDDDSIKKVFEAAKIGEHMVCVHAEDQARIEERTRQAKKKRRLPPDIHSTVRDGECARIAVAKAVKYAGQAKNSLHVCHVSTRNELIEISDGRKKGVDVSCEVTPHHLFLCERDQSGGNNRLKVNPPLRPRSDVSALWGALQSGVIDFVASDHAPHLIEEKQEKYWEAPAGVPGLETELPLLLDAANKGMLDLPRVVALASTNPARRFGLKAKGLIEEGFDADLVLVDLKGNWRVRADALKTRCGWSPFEGRTLEGVVARTIVRGKTVYMDGQVIKNKGLEVAYR